MVKAEDIKIGAVLWEYDQEQNKPVPIRIVHENQIEFWVDYCSIIYHTEIDCWEGNLSLD